MLNPQALNAKQTFHAWRSCPTFSWNWQENYCWRIIQFTSMPYLPSSCGFIQSIVTDASVRWSCAISYNKGSNHLSRTSIWASRATTVKKCKCVYLKFDIPSSSADFTNYTPAIGTLSYTVSSPLGRIQCIFCSLCHSLFDPPGTHHCWVDRGAWYERLA